jgi:hypothetical protein
MTFGIGEQPGKGRYQCVYSNDTVSLKTDGDAAGLPQQQLPHRARDTLGEAVTYGPD